MNLAKPLLALQERIGYTFQKPALLQQALTHRSFSSEHYERLEYLGDAVINVVVSDLLYQALPDMTEGQLSRIRSNLVKQDSLHSLALKLGRRTACVWGKAKPNRAVPSARLSWQMLWKPY